jgi:hypothetical protein
MRGISPAMRDMLFCFFPEKEKGGEEKHVQLHFKLREDDQFRLDQLPFRSYALPPISRTSISLSFLFRAFLFAFC